MTADFIMPLPLTRSGHDAILVMVDKLTKMVHIAATNSTITAKQTADLFVKHVIKLHGVPVKIITDRGTQFHNEFTDGVTKLISTRQGLSTAYHPQTDGQTERVNHVLVDMLRHYVSPQQDDWDEKLDMAEFAINIAHHESIGTSPFMLNYGYEPHLPVSLMSTNAVPAARDYIRSMSRQIMQARACRRGATARQKRYYDKGRVHVEFQPNDCVLLNSKNLKFKVGMPKLLPRYVGPFQINKRVGEVAYELNIPQRWRIHDVFHVSVLEPYYKDGNYQPPPPAE